jgi:uncharacterized Tic20 family protein
MKKQITHISVVQTSKVVAIFYALFSLIYTIVGIFLVGLGSSEMKIMGMVYVFMPVIMLTVGFLVMMLCCWLYNVVANWVGGVEITVEEK